MLLGSSVAFSGLLDFVDSAEGWSPVTLIVGFALSWRYVSFPFVLGWSVLSSSKVAVICFTDSILSPATASVVPSKPLDEISEAMYPLGSTATKLVRTFDKGRELLLVTLPVGERPREGGEVSSPFCSNRARREATALGDGEDMTRNK